MSLGKRLQYTLHVRSQVVALASAGLVNRRSVEDRIPFLKSEKEKNEQQPAGE